MSSEQVIRNKIDDLATRLVVAGTESASCEGMAETLAGIAGAAREAGWPDTAGVAEGLARACLAPAPAAGELEAGLERLEQALEQDARGLAAPAPQGNALAQDAELMQDFFLESREHLASIEQQSLILEQDPSNAEAIHSLFRSFHTIKGLAGFLDFAGIQRVAHEVETALDLARNGQLAIHAGVIDVILASADYLNRSIAAVQSPEAEAAGPATELLERIRALGEEHDAHEEHDAPAVAQPAVEEAVERRPAAAGRASDSFSVRVDTGKLDYLMDMVGEMVIAQSLVRHDPVLARHPDPALLRNMAHLTRITGEVQRTAMGMRMVPIGQLFRRQARLVRDLARKASKQAELELSGEDTELDKSIAEALADPLMHMVRNSLDHGIETPEERRAAGKPAAARVKLAAYHQAGQIVVEVVDDGRGLDREKIARKARERGLIQSDEGADAEIFNLIFEPGFSTAEKVTDVSGRGVGMDVVRRHVQKLRGRIEVESKKGEGTRFIVKLPLTLAIIDGLVVGVGEARYIVPIYGVREIFRPFQDRMFTVRGKEEMVLLHEKLLPVVRLYQRFHIKPRSEDPCESVLIVAENESRLYCLMVDELLGRQEVVIKSLGEVFKNIGGISGGTILGDGRVGLILDLEGIYGSRTKE